MVQNEPQATTMSNIFESYHKNTILRWKIMGKCERKKIERKSKRKKNKKNQKID